MQAIYSAVSNSVYFFQAVAALWGAYCVIVVWNRIRQKHFTNESQQLAFLEAIEDPLSRGNYEGAIEICKGDRRAVVQLSQLGIENRRLGFSKIKQLLVDRFQRDVLQDIDFRNSWVITVIKTGPMLGLLGTVLGMMAAFAKLSASKTVEPTQLSGDISFALLTTIIGLFIAIPLSVCMAFINIRIRKMEDAVSYGVNQFLEIFRQALIRYPVG